MEIITATSWRKAMLPGQLVETFERWKCANATVLHWFVEFLKTQCLIARKRSSDDDTASPQHAEVSLTEPLSEWLEAKMAEATVLKRWNHYPFLRTTLDALADLDDDDDSIAQVCVGTFLPHCVRILGDFGFVVRQEADDFIVELSALLPLIAWRVQQTKESSKRQSLVAAAAGVLEVERERAKRAALLSFAAEMEEKVASLEAQLQSEGRSLNAALRTATDTANDYLEQLEACRGAQQARAPSAADQRAPPLPPPLPPVQERSAEPYTESEETAEALLQELADIRLQRQPESPEPSPAVKTKTEVEPEQQGFLEELRVAQRKRGAVDASQIAESLEQAKRERPARPDTQAETRVRLFREELKAEVRRRKEAAKSSAPA